MALQVLFSMDLLSQSVLNTIFFWKIKKGLLKVLRKRSKTVLGFT
jgi:hypothetical protein